MFLPPYMVAECPLVSGPMATCWDPLEVFSKMTFPRATQRFLTRKRAATSYPTVTTAPRSSSLCAATPEVERRGGRSEGFSGCLG